MQDRRWPTYTPRNIVLDAVGPHLHAKPHGGKGVLGGVLGRAAVSDDERTSGRWGCGYALHICELRYGEVIERGARCQPLPDDLNAIQIDGRAVVVLQFDK